MALKYVVLFSVSCHCVLLSMILKFFVITPFLLYLNLMYSILPDYFVSVIQFINKNKVKSYFRAIFRIKIFIMKCMTPYKFVVLIHLKHYVELFSFSGLVRRFPSYAIKQNLLRTPSYLQKN